MVRIARLGSISLLMASYAQRLNTKRHRIAFREGFRCAKVAFDQLTVFCHVGLVLISGRIITKHSVAGKDNDISSLFVPIKIERDARICAEMSFTLGVGLAIDQDVLPLVVPPEPDRGRLWSPFAIYGRQPDDKFLLESPGNSLTKWCCPIGKLKWHRVFTLSSYILFLRLQINLKNGFLFPDDV